MNDYYRFKCLSVGTLWKEHWTNGGTGVTKFSNDSLPLYERAIKEYNSLDVWIEGLSLHSRLCSLEDFWKVFERLQKESQ